MRRSSNRKGRSLSQKKVVAKNSFSGPTSNQKLQYLPVRKDSVEMEMEIEHSDFRKIERLTRSNGGKKVQITPATARHGSDNLTLLDKADASFGMNRQRREREKIRPFEQKME
mmetsp:Transcript_41251/g.62807  ORF Transcript_41251/g.62807 Transcript_41251/m.62807 type:complete len:113 (+) Transcript_41251:521-859(+)